MGRALDAANNSSPATSLVIAHNCNEFQLDASALGHNASLRSVGTVIGDRAIRHPFVDAVIVEADCSPAADADARGNGSEGAAKDLTGAVEGGREDGAA